LGCNAATAAEPEPEETAPARQPLVILVTPPMRQRSSASEALQWLARHQMPDGSWNLKEYTTRCKDATCAGPEAPAPREAAATALGLLPFLAAGEMHRARGPYHKVVQKGLDWLVRHQKADGDLRSGDTMYAQGLAAIALCEAYGITGDKALAPAAQKAVDFIEKAQDKTSGGWRYAPGDSGDTSVLGWQLSALKSAQLAGLKVSDECLQGARKYLKSVAVGEHGERFKYLPGTQASFSMTAVGLLGSQYLGAKRDDPQMAAGVKYLVAHLPDPASRNCYSWYFATQVLHNMPGPEWDTWIRALRKILIEAQVREGCAAGSWDPEKPARDLWRRQGGRLVVTSLSALTLEVRYRYLLLYSLEERTGPRSKADLEY
jgi:hypothetical protein